MTRRPSTPAAAPLPRPAGWAESILALLPLRLALGALFIISGWNKILGPQAFLGSVKAFRILPDDADHILIILTFAIPWTELLAGVVLVLGLWTRGAALAIASLLLLFTAGTLSAMARGLSLDCGCFGEGVKIVCEGPLGWCHVARNLVMALAAGVLVARGGGRVALDAPLEARDYPAGTPG